MMVQYVLEQLQPYLVSIIIIVACFLESAYLSGTTCNTECVN